jgi:TM2 domain-containing membrane protein YozV/Tfp pilus assembly protein PilE
MSDMVFCHGCGKEHHRTAATCPHCGIARLRGKRYKSKAAAGILGLLIGGFGAHRFYLGQWWGIFYLLFFWTLIPGLVSFVEGIVFLCSDQTAWDEKYNDGIAGGANSGGTAVVIAVVVVFVGIAFVGILAAIALPAYQTYTLRAKVHGAYNLANQAAKTVSTYVQVKEKLPSSLSEAGFSATYPRSSQIQSIELGDSGVITVTMVGTPIDGKSFALRGSGSGATISWRCETVDLAERYLPKECRHSK